MKNTNPLKPPQWKEPHPIPLTPSPLGGYTAGARARKLGEIFQEKTKNG